MIYIFLKMSGRRDYNAQKCVQCFTVASFIFFSYVVLASLPGALILVNWKLPKAPDFCDWAALTPVYFTTVFWITVRKSWKIESVCPQSRCVSTQEDTDFSSSCVNEQLLYEQDATSKAVSSVQLKILCCSLHSSHTSLFVTLQEE